MMMIGSRFINNIKNILDTVLLIIMIPIVILIIAVMNTVEDFISIILEIFIDE